MATILNTLRVYNAFILQIDTDPSIGAGAVAGVGSLAITPAGIMYQKVGIANTAWTLAVNPSAVPFEYRVGPGLPFTTIQSAINQAALDGVGPGQSGIIVISPGTYTENLTLIPNITLQAVNQELAISQTVIDGQHTFTQNVGPVNPFDYQINFRGLTFNDSNPGNTFLVDGTGDTLVIIFGCQFQKNSLTGNAIRMTNPASIGAASQCNFFSGSSDYVLDISSPIMTMDLNSYQQGADGGFIQFSGAINLGMSNNQVQVNAPILVNVLSGNFNCRTNFFATFFANASCIQIAAGATLFGSNNTLVCLPGTGFPYTGTGTVNAGNTIYGGGNSTVDPALTYNQFPVDPKIARLITGNDTLTQFDGQIVLNDNTAGSWNLNLPAGVDGMSIGFGVTAANTGSWTLVPNGADTVDAAVPVLSAPTRIVFISGTWYLCY